MRKNIIMVHKRGLFIVFYSNVLYIDLIRFDSGFWEN